MQVRQILVASILAVTAAGAMSQELDPSETLQAKNLAAQQMQIGSPEGRTRASVAAETRAAEASGQIKVGERADGLPVDAAPNTSWAKRHATHPYAKTWLGGDKRPSHKVVVGELG